MSDDIYGRCTHCGGNLTAGHKCSELEIALEGVNASHDDEEAAHKQTLRMLKIAQEQVEGLEREVAKYKNAFERIRDAHKVLEALIK